MPKILNLEYENPKTKAQFTGSMEIKNQTADSADLYFYGEICSSKWQEWSDDDKCPQDVADFLNSLNGVGKINVYINSPGGDSFAGNAIYNILKRNAASKTVYIEGVAASAASVIAMVGNPIIMPPGAQVMIHNAWTIIMGNANDLRKEADTLDKVSASHIEIYAENAAEGVTPEQFKAMMDAETWMDGTEAAKVFKSVKVEGERVAASIDARYFDRYKNIPEKVRQPTSKDPKPPAPPEPPEPPADDIAIKIAKVKLNLAIASTQAAAF